MNALKYYSSVFVFNIFYVFAYLIIFCLFFQYGIHLGEVPNAFLRFLVVLNIFTVMLILIVKNLILVFLKKANLFKNIFLYFEQSKNVQIGTILFEFFIDFLLISFSPPFEIIDVLSIYIYCFLGLGSLTLTFLTLLVYINLEQKGLL